MKTVFILAATGTLLLSGIASAAELPSYELSGLPVTPHQISVLGLTANVEEAAPSASLVVAGMPASPAQMSILTPRARTTPTLAEAE
jgi:hypothetical protein